jgi:hypothetical protein
MPVHVQLFAFIFVLLKLSVYTVKIHYKMNLKQIPAAERKPKAELSTQLIEMHQLIAVSCFIDRSQYLVSIKIYLPPQYNQ